MTQFKSGDLVVLRSGGPTMTVDTVNTDIFDDDKITGVLCVWFVGEIMQRVRFDHRAVRLASERQEGPLTDPRNGFAGNGTPNGAAAATLRASIVMASPEITPASARMPAMKPGAATEPNTPVETIAAISTAPPGIAAGTEAPAPDTSTAASETNPTPPPTAAPEAVGDYAAVLDSMVGAMNATAEMMAPAPRPPRRAKTALRAARGKDTTTH